MLHGPYGEGTGIGDATKWSIFRDILRTNYGRGAEKRLILLALAIPALIFLKRACTDRKLPPWGLAGCGAVAVLVAATPALAGHASAGDETESTRCTCSPGIWLGGLSHSRRAGGLFVGVAGHRRARNRPVGRSARGHRDLAPAGRPRRYPRHVIRQHPVVKIAIVASCRRRRQPPDRAPPPARRRRTRQRRRVDEKMYRRGARSRWRSRLAVGSDGLARWRSLQAREPKVFSAEAKRARHQLDADRCRDPAKAGPTRSRHTLLRTAGRLVSNMETSLPAKDIVPPRI